jgi:chemotaxis protein CheC
VQYFSKGVFMDKKIELNIYQLDAITETVSIGAGNAATALNKMVGHKIMIEIPKVTIHNVEEISNIFKDPDKVAVSIIQNIEGDIKGLAMLLFPYNSALSLVRILSNSSSDSIDMSSEITVSLLKEVGNILSGSYLTAISDFLGIKTISSIPMLVIDQVAAIITATYISFWQGEMPFICIQTLFLMDDKAKAIYGYFLFFPTEQGLNTMLDRLDKILKSNK